VKSYNALENSFPLM